MSKLIECENNPHFAISTQCQCSIWLLILQLALSKQRPSARLCRYDPHPQVQCQLKLHCIFEQMTLGAAKGLQCGWMRLAFTAGCTVLGKEPLQLCSAAWAHPYTKTPSVSYENVPHSKGLIKEKHNQQLGRQWSW